MDFVTYYERKEQNGVGHMLRINSFMTNIFEGRINGLKGRGKPIKIFILEMIVDCNQNVNTKRLTINGEKRRTRFVTTRQSL